MEPSLGYEIYIGVSVYHVIVHANPEALEFRCARLRAQLCMHVRTTVRITRAPRLRFLDDVEQFEASGHLGTILGAYWANLGYLEPFAAIMKSVCGGLWG